MEGYDAENYSQKEFASSQNNTRRLRSRRSSQVGLALLYLDVLVLCQPTRHSDELVVVQVEFPQMRSVGQRAIVHGRDAVETQPQPAEGSRN